MFFLNEKQKGKSLTLIYIMTLGKSLEENSSLAKVSQLGWLGTPNRGTPSGFICYDLKFLEWNKRTTLVFE